MVEGKPNALRPVAPKVFTALGIACLIMACLPAYSATENDGTKTTRISVGLPFSPWLLFVHESTEQRSENGSFTSSFSQRSGIEFISWSMFLLVASQLLFFVARKIRSRGSRAIGNQ